MAQIRVNDIFDELIEENIEINKCLNILIKFKTFVDLIFNEMKTNLKSKHLQMYYDLNKEVLDVFKSNKRQLSSEDKNKKQRKSQLFEILSSKPQNCDNNSLQTNSKTNHSNDSFNNYMDLDLISPMIKTNPLLKKSSKTYSKNVRNKGVDPIDPILINNMTQTLIQDSNESKDIISFGKTIDFDFINCGKELQPINNNSILNIEREDKKQYLCDVEGCHYTTNIKRSLGYHQNRHNGVKPYSCGVCDRKFSTPMSLSKHNFQLHRKHNIGFKCLFDGCGKIFTNKDYLKTHAMSHSNIRFACEWPECEKSFKTKLSLNNHTSRDHLGVRQFVCKVKNCSKAYAVKQDLNVHIMTHSQYNFKCQFEGCDKIFKTFRTLKTHSILHTDFVFSCDWPGCDFTTKRKNCLRTHQSVHSSERPFLCDWPECGKRFKHKNSLETHQRIHTSNKKFVCNWPGCQYRCTDSGNLYKHRRVHNKN